MCGIPGKAGRCCCASKAWGSRSEEHTSELQSHLNLVCRLLLEKKKIKYLGNIVITTVSASLAEGFAFCPTTGHPPHSVLHNISEPRCAEPMCHNDRQSIVTQF